MAADIVAYSRLIETDEARTLTAMRAIRSRIIEPLIAEHRGRIVKLMGDGAIVEFGSVVEAVACAVAMQEGTAIHQREVPPESRIVYRIGINVGDVVVDDGDLLGDGVNIAARLEALAEPGGICIADAVQKQLAGKTDFAFEDTGERPLKNIAQPVRVWRWTREPGLGDTVAPLALPDRPSIAVLPFDNLSGQPEDTYFSDGITEDIVTGLAHFRSLFVIARNSSFAFRGKATSLAEIGRQLGVSYLLEGSVRRAGARVRITAQLIEAATWAHLWAERYDRSLDDIFAVQDEVTMTIVRRLLGGSRTQNSSNRCASQQSASQPMTSFCGASRVSEVTQRTTIGKPAPSLRRPSQTIRTTPWRTPISRSPGLPSTAMGLPPLDIRRASSVMARRGVDLDPQEGGCHRILGQVLLYVRELDVAEHHARRAVELNPNDADGAISMGDLLVTKGHPVEGLAWTEKASASVPLSGLRDFTSTSPS
ncbi:adenylate/guanylate cyclase domain-containing protein [Mesorhizobium sp.]|uniref:adenylate/guanylate cyclase domain-containing protein n=1 Tax=Mesorhizobium sp. TaxID=1871066 RepID=UPI00257FB06E|nr:adenylate/guanylate cyclase domain-containing protein [Mesorhizobium sp.]